MIPIFTYLMKYQIVVYIHIRVESIWLMFGMQMHNPWDKTEDTFCTIYYLVKKQVHRIHIKHIFKVCTRLNST